MAVGGLKKDDEPTNELYVYNEMLKRWRREIPPMPTARYNVGVVSLQSALMVAGGDKRSTPNDLVSQVAYTLNTAYGLAKSGAMAAVEIFKSDTSQWYKTDPLHKVVNFASGIAIGNTCYVLGTHHFPFQMWSQTLYASVDDLLHNAVPANQTTHSGSSDTQSPWMTLPTPSLQNSFAAELAGNLVAVGTDNQVHMYISSSSSWVNIGDIPRQENPYTGVAVANLSPLEIVVFAKKVYKGIPVYI